MKKKLKNIIHRFDIQVSLFYLLTSFIVIGFFGIVIYYSVSHVFIDNAVSTTKNILEMSSMNIETYIQKINSEAAVFAENTQLQEYLVGVKSQRSGVEKQIQSMMNHDSFIQSIIIVSKNGEVISNEKNLDMTTSSDMMKEDWYKNAIHNSMPVLSGARMQAFSDDMNNLVISTSTEIKDKTGHNLGVLLIDMKYSVIENFLVNIDMGDNGYVFIVNQEHKLVYYKDPHILSNHQEQEKLLKILSLGNRYNEQDNTLIHQSEISHTDWILVGVLPMDNLVILKHHLLEQVVIIAFLLAIIVVGFGSYFSRRLSLPMKKLEKGMQEIEKLAEIPIPQKSYYEVEVFTKNYNFMIEKIKGLMADLSKNQELLKQSEMDLLISQMNPHFLYNTLDTIVWMAELGHKEKVISLTKSLATFFRLSLNNGQDMITLGEELEHVQQYLYIQKERYGDKLTYTIEADDEVKNYFIPKILLQPIVENSIYHGIKKLSGNGHIHIHVETQGDDIIMSVTDNGVGFDQKRQNDIQKGMLGGFGLNNVQQRIKLYYGDDYGLTIISHSNAGCKVVIKIKKELKL